MATNAGELAERFASVEAAVDALMSTIESGTVPASSCPALVARVARLRHRLGALECDLAARVASMDMWRRSGAKSVGE